MNIAYKFLSIIFEKITRGKKDLCIISGKMTVNSKYIINKATYLATFSADMDSWSMRM